jgi:ribosome-associated protein
MINLPVKQRDFSQEYQLSFSRSGGSGGQNVNKVNTKVTLHFRINQSNLLTDHEKKTIQQKLANNINNEGYLVIQADGKRTQLGNKTEAEKKLKKMLAKALFKKKKRKETRPPKSAIRKRIDNKKKHGEKKQLRKRVW